MNHINTAWASDKTLADSHWLNRNFFFRYTLFQQILSSFSGRTRRLYLRGGYGINPPPRNVNKFCAWTLSFALHNKEAKLLPLDTCLSRKNAQKCVCGRGSATDPAGWAYSAPPDLLAGNGGGVPREGGKGRRGKSRGREGRGGGGKGKGYPPRTKILSTAFVLLLNAKLMLHRLIIW